MPTGREAKEDAEELSVMCSIRPERGIGLYADKYPLNFVVGHDLNSAHPVRASTLSASVPIADRLHPAKLPHFG
jgi:hypothetical protein